MVICFRRLPAAAVLCVLCLEILAQYPNPEAITASTHVEIESLWRRTFRELAPEGFPLQQCPLSYIKAGQLFLTDRNRWSLPTP